MKIIKNQKGFAILDVLVASVVFAVGVLGLSALQYRAVLQNAYSWHRTEANKFATAVLEELKGLPFTDARLANGAGNLDAGKPAASGDPAQPALADHNFNIANFPALTNCFRASQPWIKNPQIFYNVQQNTEIVGATAYRTSCTIRLFIYWQDTLGPCHLEMNTVKINTTAI